MAQFLPYVAHFFSAMDLIVLRGYSEIVWAMNKIIRLRFGQADEQHQLWKCPEEGLLVHWILQQQMQRATILHAQEKLDNVEL